MPLIKILKRVEDSCDTRTPKGIGKLIEMLLLTRLALIQLCNCDAAEAVVDGID